MTSGTRSRPEGRTTARTASEGPRQALAGQQDATSRSRAGNRDAAPVQRSTEPVLLTYVGTPGSPPFTAEVLDVLDDGAIVLQVAGWTVDVDLSPEYRVATPAEVEAHAAIAPTLARLLDGAPHLGNLSRPRSTRRRTR